VTGTPEPQDLDPTAPRSTSAQRHDPDAPRVIPPAPSTIDLHSHTTLSDGLLEPLPLAMAAHGAGVRLLAITDHDTLAGYREVRERLRGPVAGTDAGAGASVTGLDGLELLPGVELNAVMGHRPELLESEVHVLGLGVDADDAAFEDTLQRQRSERRIRFGAMVARCREIGLPIHAALTEVPTEDDAALGRPTLARAMVTLGYAESVEDAFNRFLSRGRPAYVPRGGLGPIEAVAAIRAAGGVPVLAHFAEAPERRDLLTELIDAGLQGLEAYHASFDAATVERLRALAAELGLLVTGGSDYHGDRETYAEAHVRLWVPPEVVPPLEAAMAAASVPAAGRGSQEDRSGGEVRRRGPGR
jgi:predicted metal-dependent phosphoesterase TrpH